MNGEASAHELLSAPFLYLSAPKMHSYVNNYDPFEVALFFGMFLSQSVLGQRVNTAFYV